MSVRWGNFIEKRILFAMDAACTAIPLGWLSAAEQNQAVQYGMDQDLSGFESHNYHPGSWHFYWRSVQSFGIFEVSKYVLPGKSKSLKVWQNPPRLCYNSETFPMPLSSLGAWWALKLRALPIVSTLTGMVVDAIPSGLGPVKRISVAGQFASVRSSPWNPSSSHLNSKERHCDLSFAPWTTVWTPVRTPVRRCKKVCNYHKRRSGPHHGDVNISKRLSHIGVIMLYGTHIAPLSLCQACCLIFEEGLCS